MFIISDFSNISFCPLFHFCSIFHRFGLALKITNFNLVLDKARFARAIADISGLFSLQEKGALLRLQESPNIICARRD